MAVVFRARDESLDRWVALKILTPSMTPDWDGFRERFVRESRAAAAAEHPHILPVYGAGSASGVPYIAMRLATGGDLYSLVLREGRLAPPRTARLICAIASALDAAHAVGLVHRDVKPGNILIDSAGAGELEHVYLADFGLSKKVASTAALTGTGQVMGTPDYMAPEQITGKLVDARADQYSLACVAVALLTGRPPYVRDDPMAVMWAHVTDPPPSVASARHGIPARADHVITRALAKSPDERYSSCGEFADALRTALSVAADQATASPDGVRRRRRRPRLMLAGLLAVSAVAAGAALMLATSPLPSASPPAASGSKDARPAATQPHSAGGTTTGALTDSVTGLSYSLLPSPWSPGCPSALSRQTFTWTAGEAALAWRSGANTWYGLACSGMLGQQAVYSGVTDLEPATLSLVAQLDAAYFRGIAHSRSQLLSAPVLVSGHHGWEVKYLMTYPDATSKGLSFTSEAGIVVVIDRGAGVRPAVFWASVPSNLDQSSIDTLLHSLR
jgi:serine/threonine-protein kinase